MSINILNKTGTFLYNIGYTPRNLAAGAVGMWVAQVINQYQAPKRQNLPPVSISCTPLNKDEVCFCIKNKQKASTPVLFGGPNQSKELEEAKNYKKAVRKHSKATSSDIAFAKNYYDKVKKAGKASTNVGGNVEMASNAGLTLYSGTHQFAEPVTGAIASASTPIASRLVGKVTERLHYAITRDEGFKDAKGTRWELAKRILNETSQPPCHLFDKNGKRHAIETLNGTQQTKLNNLKVKYENLVKELDTLQYEDDAGFSRVNGQLDALVAQVYPWMKVD
jgi:hypothetical protein